MNKKIKILFVAISGWKWDTYEFSTLENLAHTKIQVNELLAPNLLDSIAQSMQFDALTANKILVKFSTAMAMENSVRKQSTKPQIKHSKHVRTADRLHRLLRRAAPVALRL